VTKPQPIHAGIDLQVIPQRGLALRGGGLVAPMNFPAGKPTVDSRCVFAMLAGGGKWGVLNGGKIIC